MCKCGMWRPASRLGSSLNTHSGQVSSVAFSPDGKTLATGDDSGAARLWDVAAAEQASRAVTGGSYLIAAAAFSPDGKTLATVDGNGSVRLWDIATARQIGPALKLGASPEQGGENGIASVAFSPDGKTLAAGDDSSNLARLWNTATGQQIGPALNTGPRGDGISSVAFSPDGKTLATVQNGGSVQLWDVATGHKIGKPFASSSFSVAFSPDGKTLATGDFDSTVRLWNVATRHQIGSPLRGGPSGSESSSGNFRWRSAQTGERWQPATRTARSGCGTWRPASRSAACSTPGPPLIHRCGDVQPGRDNPGDRHYGRPGPAVGRGDRSADRQFAQSPALGQLEFSPDGKTLLATGGRDGSVRLWDVGYLVGTLAQLCTQVGSSLTPAEWAQHVPPGPAYRKICP